MWCKWARPYRNVFFACWNEKEVKKVLDSDVGLLDFESRKHCKAIKETPECYDPLIEKCVKYCKHYFYWERGGYGYCHKYCYNFEKFEMKEDLLKKKIKKYWNNISFEYDYFGLMES